MDAELKVPERLTAVFPPEMNIQEVTFGDPLPVPRSVDPFNSLVPAVELDRDFRAPSHTESVFKQEEFPGIVEWVVEIMRARQMEAIAGSGHSGLIVAGAVAYVLRVPVIAVRKRGDPTKGDSLRINAVVPHKPFTYGLVDDFVCSGETVARVYDEVRGAFPQARMSDLMLYRIHGDGSGRSWSAVEEARNTLRRMIGEGFAGSVRIHGYM